MLVGQEIAHRDLILGLKNFSTIRELCGSDFYRKNQQRLRTLLETTELYPIEDVRPEKSQFVRSVQWNIEKGKNFEGIARTLLTHPLLKHAELIFLNEVDCGMNRSENRKIAYELGQRLRMHTAFAPAHLELTKGINGEPDIPGENTRSLQGNAILSRHSLSNPRVISLPQCFEHFEVAEKRFGRRIALVVEVQLHEGVTLTAVCTHLETRTTPGGRARQMKAILDTLEQWNVRGPILIAGDLNTSTFARGTRLRAMRGVLRIILVPSERLQREMLRPDLDGEPLFQLLGQRGYQFLDLNDENATYIQPVEVVEDAHYVPGFSQKMVIKKFAPYGGRAGLKLDWFVGKNIRVLSGNEIVDPLSSISSTSPQTVHDLVALNCPLSDHHPIVADFTC